MRKFLAAALVLAGVATAEAQELSIEQPKNEVAGTIGRTFVSDQTPPNTNFFDNTVHFGKGLTFNVDYARRFRRYGWGDLLFEVPVIFNVDQDLNYGTNQIPRQYSTFFVTPAARVNLIPALPISPWVSFGGGLGRFSASHELIFFGTNSGPRGSTSGVLQMGLGMDVRLPKFRDTRFRFEFRDDWSGAPPLSIDTGRSRQHNYYVGGGLVFHFGRGLP